MKQCSKHGSDLLRGTVETRSGYPPAPPDGYFEAQEGLFPFANSWVMGGCVIDLESDGTESVDYCPECRAAEKAWQSENEMEEFWKV